jgi:predicted dehydrogenase/nucleoside-diphosphate-sugar epimerase
MARSLALVGCGAVSRVYYVPACRAIPECRIEWFVDKSYERAKQLARDYGGGQVTGDYKEIIGSVDAAIVALPNYLHAPVTVDLLRHGCDVLCEKPIATNSTEGKEMIEASNECGTRLAVNLIRRRYNSFRIAKLLLNAGTIGKVESVNCEEGRIFEWQLSSLDLLDPKRAGGGVLMDWGTHNLDILRWLFSGELELISYQDDSLGGVEANCDLELKIRSDHEDIPCRINLGRSRILQNTVTISGEKGSLEIRQDELNRVYMRLGGRVQKTEPSERENRSLGPKNYFAEQVRKSLDRSSNDFVSGAEALTVLSFIEDCYRNKRQMTFPWERFRAKPPPRIPNSWPGAILVVGASGFLGTRLVEKLSANIGLKVRAAVHRPSAAARLARLPVQLVQCDLLDPQQVDKAVEGCSIVINCASGPGDMTYKVSVGGTRNLLQAAVNHKVEKYIHLSSAAVHGFSHRKCVVNEESRFVLFGGAYERGKIESENVVSEYAKSLGTVIFRPTLIYGPYSSSWTVEIIKRIRDHQPTIVQGGGLANLVYVDDVVEAIVCALENTNVNGETLILNNDEENARWADYVEMYAKPAEVMPVSSPEYNPTLQRMKMNFLMLRDSLTSMADIARSPELLALLARIPLVVKLGSVIIRGQRRKALEDNLAVEMEIPKADSKILNRYEGINKQLYKLLTCQAVFSSAKSRKLLRLDSLTSIRDGIARTVQWAKWAGYYYSQMEESRVGAAPGEAKGPT